MKIILACSEIIRDSNQENIQIQSMNVSPVFGRAKSFIIYDTESKKFCLAENPGQKCINGAGVNAAQYIVDLKADVLICNMCGENAYTVLRAQNIKVFRAQGNSAAENIQMFQDNLLNQITY